MLDAATVRDDLKCLKMCRLNLVVFGDLSDMIFKSERWIQGDQDTLISLSL